MTTQSSSLRKLYTRKQVILAKNEAFRAQIEEGLPQVCDHYHFERTTYFRHFVGRYDQWVFTNTEGDVIQKLNKFAAEGSIPLVRLCFRELTLRHLPATKAMLIRDDRLVKVIFQTKSFRELSYLAIRGGHLPLLRWLLTNGYPYYPIILERQQNADRWRFSNGYTSLLV